MKTTSQNFDAAYAMLNAGQKQAVDTIDGPVMVVAGPGTGKTQVLATRIANILIQTDTDPDSILALTFTEAAAINMRKRLHKLAGKAANQVMISTFHGFAQSVINDYPEYFPDIIGSEPLTEFEQLNIIETIITDSDKLDLLKPYGDKLYYVRPIISVVSELKREAILPEDLASIAAKELQKSLDNPDRTHAKGAHAGKVKGDVQKHERKIAKNQELAIIYTQYQEALQLRKRYDFNDMLLLVKNALSDNPELCQTLQERFHYFMVDEHQDTNRTQNKLVELLTAHVEQPNVFVVGDPKQAIFRFQGASLQNFLYFNHVFTGATLINLTDNYRSTQTIVDAAHSLMVNADGVDTIKPTPLTAKAQGAGQPIDVYQLPDIDTEMYTVASMIAKHIANGVNPEEIGVLYRNNKHAFDIARLLEKMNVPLQIESDTDIMNNNLVQQFMAIIKAVVWLDQDQYVAAALPLPTFNLDPLDVMKTIRQAYAKRKYTLLDVVRDPKLRSGIELTDSVAITAVGKKITNWAKAAAYKPLLTICEDILRTSGMLQLVLAAQDNLAGLEAINVLFENIKQFALTNNEARLVDWLAYLEQAKAHNMYVKATTKRQAKAVRLMTMHRAKGLEFEHVFVLGCYRGNIGGRAQRNTLPLLEAVYYFDGSNDVQDHSAGGFSASDDDERRLFYVALTRGKQSVTVTYPTINHTGKEVLPSPFLDEIDPSMISMQNADVYINEFAKIGGAFAMSAPDKPTSGMPIDPLFVQEILQKQGLSISAINTYFQSPWQFFFRYILRIPSAPTKHQAYGIAVHAALHDLFEGLKNETAGINKQFLLNRFKYHVSQVPTLEAKDLHDTIAKGNAALDGWYDTYQSGWITQTLNEHRISGVYLNETIRLTGVFDKVEFIDENEVMVVDYKTGKPKSRNAIMGNTKTDNGNYYRQIIFYKLLLDKYQGGRYSMSAGVIDFIEPDTKGKYHKEVFEVTTDEVLDLEQQILNMVEDLTTLSFWSTPPTPDTCDYCDMYQSLAGGSF